MSSQANRFDIVSVVALVVSILALGFSGLQWWVSRGQLAVSQNQLLLSMKPSISFDTESDAANLPVGVRVENAGPGPAVITSFTYYLDKKPVGTTGDAALDAAGLSGADSIINLDLESGDTLAVGENQWLIQYKKPRSRQDRDDVQKLAELLDKRLAIEIEFCPVLGGKCQKKCSTTGACEGDEDRRGK